VAAAKPLVAAALLALALAGAAHADDPKVDLTKADQERATAGLLKLADFGMGWQGGSTRAHKLVSPGCPGFNPRESDLVVSGHAEAHFAYRRGGVSVGQDVQVLKTPQAVRTDFVRTIKPPLARCLAYRLRKTPRVVSASVERIPFPQVGSVSAAYRATLVIKDGSRVVRLYDDYVFFGIGRYEFALNVVAPAAAGAPLVNFEAAIAQLLARRSDHPCC
jgi:hypothetical protein